MLAPFLLLIILFFFCYQVVRIFIKYSGSFFFFGCWLAAGTSANIVDANLGILRGRIAEVRMKERLDVWCRLKSGWNYQLGYDYRHKRDHAMFSESLVVLGEVSRTLGLVFLSGSLCICLASVLVHFSI